MSRNLVLEKVGRAIVAYKLQQKGWLVGEAFDDGFDLLAVYPETNDICKIELKTMDLDNRAEGTNLTAPVSRKEQEICTHIIIYLEPEGRYFIAKKDKILTKKGSIFAATDSNGVLRKPRKGSFSFAIYENCWEQLKENKVQ